MTSGKSCILLKTDPILIWPPLSIRPFLPMPTRLLTMKPPEPVSQMRLAASMADRIYTWLPERWQSSALSRLAVTLPLSDSKCTLSASSLESPGFTPVMFPVVRTSKLKSWGIWAQKSPFTAWVSYWVVHTSLLFSPIGSSFKSRNEAPLDPAFTNFSMSAKSISSVALPS